MPFTLIQWLFTFEEESNFGDGMPLWIHLKLFGEGEGGGGLNRSKKVITKYVRDGFVDGTELKVFSPSISPKKKKRNRRCFPSGFRARQNHCWSSLGKGLWLTPTAGETWLWICLRECRKCNGTNQFWIINQVALGVNLKFLILCIPYSFTHPCIFMKNFISYVCRILPEYQIHSKSYVVNVIYCVNSNEIGLSDPFVSPSKSFISSSYRALILKPLACVFVSQKNCIFFIHKYMICKYSYLQYGLKRKRIRKF